ncbi:MAG: DUF6167 family protein [Nocardioidaceae bacterium]
MSRVVWFAAGAGAGVMVLAKARRAAEVLTPDGLADRLAGLSLGVHLFREEVRAGMAEKENDVRERLAVTFHGTPPVLPAGDAATTTPAAERSAPTREGTH